jgi:opacity protein-like surface antigen
MKTKFAAAVLFILAALLSNPALAGNFDASGFVGGNFSDGELGMAEYPLADDLTTFKLDQNLLFGFRLSYNYTNVLSFEGSLTVVPGSMKAEIFDAQSQSGSDLKVLDASVYLFSANAMYNFPVAQTTVFFTAGLGTATFSTGSPVGFADGVVPEGSTDFAFNIGAGVKYSLGDRFYVRGDLRKYFFEDDFGISTFSKNPGVLELSVGVGVTFGGERSLF